MHLQKQESRQLNEAFRARVIALLDDQRITQEEIADALGVSQSTVSRYLAYGGDMMFPAALTPTLNTPRLRPLAIEILRFQAERLGVSLQPTIGKPELDGALDDECAMITVHLGKLIEEVKRDPTRLPHLRRQVEMIDGYVERARAEILRLEMR